MLDAVVGRLVRLVIMVFFRQAEVVGADHIPRGVPLVVVANHVNSLIDPLLLLGCLGVRPRFLAKSTLWRNPLLRPLLALAGVIPVYRRQDRAEGVDTSRNAETFARCHELLRRGGTVALFPEGVSHSEPSLRPLRTGAARIALEAEARFGPLGIRIVPVGLVFDAKSSFRSRALVLVGEPIEAAATAYNVEAGTGDPAGSERAGVRRLTDRINRELAAVTLNYESWEQARLIERAADLWSRPSGDLPYDRPLADQFPVRQVFISGMEKLRLGDEQAVSAVAEAVASYDQLLALTGLRDDQVGSLYPRSLVVSFAWRSLLRLLLLLPLAAVGSVLNWPPYRACALIAARFAQVPDTQSTYKVFPALLLYPLTWTVETAAVALLAGPWAGAVMVLLTPLSGWGAAIFHQRRRRLAIETRAYLLLRRHRGLIGDLQRQRAQLLAQVSGLVERYQELDPQDGPGDEQ